MKYSNCKTIDQLTVALLIDNNQAGIQKLHKKLEESMKGTMECPNCGDTNPKDSNDCGQNDPDRMFLCGACGEVFDAPTTIDVEELELEEA